MHTKLMFSTHRPHSVQSHPYLLTLMQAPNLLGTQTITLYDSSTTDLYYINTLVTGWYNPQIGILL